MVKIEPRPIEEIPFRSSPRVGRVEVIPIAELGPGFVAPQRPRFDLLIHARSGAGRHEVDFASYPLDAGDLVWVRAGQVQRWGALDAYDGRVVLFRSEILAPATVQALRAAGSWSRTRWPAAACPPEVVAMIDLLATLGETPAAGRMAAAEHLVAALLLRLGDEAEPGGRPRPAGRRARLYDDFVHLLDTQGGVHRSVETFARLLGCTPKTLNLAVRERSDRTAKQALDHRLGLEARRLLVYRPDLPVGEVGVALGFDDPANFSKFFVRQTGVTPGAFRRRYLPEPPAAPRA